MHVITSCGAIRCVGFALREQSNAISLFAKQMHGTADETSSEAIQLGISVLRMEKPNNG